MLLHFVWWRNQKMKCLLISKVEVPPQVAEKVVTMKDQCDCYIPENHEVSHQMHAYM